jgi:hypothetical protein
MMKSRRTGNSIERERTCRKSNKNNKTDEHKSESEATYQRPSPRNGSMESPVSSLRRSSRSRK